MHAGLDGQAAFGQRGAEKFCIFLKLVAQFGRCAENKAIELLHGQGAEIRPAKI